MTNETIKAIVTAESSISHSCILSEEETRTRKKGNTSALRRETLISYATETDFDDDDEPIEKTVMHSYRMPIVSGNSIRGIGRQLLITDTIDDVLGFDFGEIAAMDLPAMNAKKMAAYTAQLFYKGGITPAGCQMVLSEAGAYDNVMNTLPFLDLLGGVYGNHHFTGSLRARKFTNGSRRGISSSRVCVLPPARQGKGARISDAIPHRTAVRSMQGNLRR